MISNISGNAVMAANTYDGCTCAAMFWVFLPCWIGLNNRVGSTSSPLRHHQLLFNAYQRRHVLSADLKATLTRRRRLVTNGNDSGPRDVTTTEGYRHQTGCFCGMPSEDVSGKLCGKSKIRHGRTLAMIKPDAIQHREQIKEMIRQNGFTIVRVIFLI
jgi:hypothetical protein